MVRCLTGEEGHRSSAVHLWAVMDGHGGEVRISVD
jgi:hypothetical protein